MVVAFCALCFFLMLSSTSGDDYQQATEVPRTTTSRRPGAPYFLERPFNATVLVDEVFTLPCRVGGEPKPQIKWWNNYDVIRRRSDNHRILRSGNLRFPRILMNHSGFYRCQGSNENGKIISNYAFLQVDAPAVIAEGPTERDVKEGATVHLKCLAFGEPKPTLSWTVDGETLVDPETQRAYNKAFYKFNATVTQRYECRAENKYRVYRSAATVSVTETPKGRCEPYSGKICKYHLGNRLVWYNVSLPSNMSGIQEDNVYRQWKELVSSVSATCRPAAEAMMCESAFPGCDNSSDVPVQVPLCPTHCTAIETQFCHASWDIMSQIAAQSNITMVTCKHSSIHHSNSHHSNQSPLQHRTMPEACSKVNLFQVIPSQITTTCYRSNGDHYRGSVHVAGENLTCQRWDTQYPHIHTHVTEHLFPILTDAGNACRNPGGIRARPWCYVNTTDVEQQWHFCDIPECADSYSEDAPSSQSSELREFFTTDTIVIVVMVAMVTITLIILVVLLCHRVYQAKSKFQYNRASQSDFTIDIEKLPSNMSYHQEAPKTVPEALEQVEYPRNDIVFVKDIGQGAFGRVFKARAPKILDGHESTLVVVKMLKQDASEAMEADFERESAILVELDHPNIIKLLGVCAMGRPRCLLFEFMSRGDLNQYLRNCSPDHFIVRNRSVELISNPGDRPRLDHIEQLEICRQLASAMVYLSRCGYVHRDIAARNCLVGDDLVVKISDFGLTQCVLGEEGGVYIGSESDAIPIRWMPLEAILYNQFTVASDVWSFGVLLWEIFSFALQPYYDLDLEETIKFISEGRVMSCPDNTPEAAHDIMMTCWKLSPQERPPFTELHKQLCHLQDSLREARNTRHADT